MPEEAKGRVLPFSKFFKLLSNFFPNPFEEIRKLRAKAMKIINPNSKLIAVVCDPIKRAFSQLRLMPIIRSKIDIKKTLHLNL